MLVVWFVMGWILFVSVMFWLFSNVEVVGLSFSFCEVDFVVVFFLPLLSFYNKSLHLSFSQQSIER